MKTSDEQYEKIMKALRLSKPEPDSVDEIEFSVMRTIGEMKKPVVESSFFDFIFGWIWIGWVRRSLATAAFCLVAFFIWQQHSILNKIENLQFQVRQSDRMVKYDPSFNLEKKLLLNRISEENNLPGEITVRKDDIARLIDSLQKVQSRYRDILRVIENDPVLKKAFEEQLKKNTPQGLNL